LTIAQSAEASGWTEENLTKSLSARCQSSVRQRLPTGKTTVMTNTSNTARETMAVIAIGREEGFLVISSIDRN
jgi:hypothetical protein